MHYYYSEHECSHVKGYSIPLVLMSQPCPAFLFLKRTFFLFKDMIGTCM